MHLGAQLTRKSAAVAAVLVAVAWLLTACPGSRLDADPGLFAEDFGTGISLGQFRVDAQDAAKQTDGWEVWLLTRDELHGHNPYTERTPGTDLVVALYLPAAEAGQLTADSLPAERVNELRLYLGAPGESSLRFRGVELAGVSYQEMTELLGPPAIPAADGQDGLVHLTYYFSLADQPGNVLKLVSSHYLVEKSCMSLSVAIVSDPG